MPTIFDLLEMFAFLRGMPAAIWVLITAVIIVIVWDWRLALMALASQYLIAGLLFVDILDPRLSIIKVLVGLFICLMLYFTARQVTWGRLPEDILPREAARLPSWRQVGDATTRLRLLRIGATAIVAVIIWRLAPLDAYRLPAVSDGTLNLAILALGTLGLFGFSLTSEPLKAGMSLLTFFTGFELFYNGLEQSVALLAFMAAGNLAIALAICYLTQARHSLVALVE